MVHHPKDIQPTWHNCGKHWCQHGPASLFKKEKNNILIYNDPGWRWANCARPMALPITAGCDAAWNWTTALRCSVLDHCVTRESQSVESLCICCYNSKLSPSSYLLVLYMISLMVQALFRLLSDDLIITANSWWHIPSLVCFSYRPHMENSRRCSRWTW